jgi:hypothetical protein
MFDDQTTREGFWLRTFREQSCVLGPPEHFQSASVEWHMKKLFGLLLVAVAASHLSGAGLIIVGDDKFWEG